MEFDFPRVLLSEHSIVLYPHLLHLSYFQLKSNPEFYEGYVPMEYGEYLKKMSKYYSTLTILSDLVAIQGDPFLQIDFFID